VEAGNPDAITTALESMAVDEDLWRSSSKRGPEVAKEHSWEATADVVRDAYSKALSR